MQPTRRLPSTVAGLRSPGKAPARSTPDPSGGYTAMMALSRPSGFMYLQRAQGISRNHVHLSAGPLQARRQVHTCLSKAQVAWRSTSPASCLPLT